MLTRSSILFVGLDLEARSELAFEFSSVIFVVFGYFLLWRLDLEAGSGLAFEFSSLFCDFVLFGYFLLI